MSKFLINDIKTLTPYVPGEQPKTRKFIKLNTNESPFPPCNEVISAINEKSGSLNLYSDPTASSLTTTASEFFKVKPQNIIFGNGSDEILFFIFKAFFSQNNPLIFPEFTYGFYEVFASLLKIDYKKIPLNNDFSINLSDYIGVNKGIVIANPNAPTGIALTKTEVEKIVASNPNNVVVIDEAYVDFGGETCIPLINKYNNLIIVRTFSKSASLAGGRLGFAIANEELIADLNLIKYSINPYNVNALTLSAGEATILNYTYYDKNCKTIIKNREYLTEKLTELGFSVLNSRANFIFAKNNKISGESLYNSLKERGILVRYFSNEKIKDFVRITIGTITELNQLISEIKDIIKD